MSMSMGTDVSMDLGEKDKIMMDSFNKAVGALLSQELDRVERPIAFTSQKPTPQEERPGCDNVVADFPSRCHLPEDHQEQQTAHLGLLEMREQPYERLA
ncbi:hypothetical protein Y1Q_0015694 [Alligator mississippiensis]|uniref:Uncharacterized protein n=1 Tax=Alligator mississippiensis TaxID=8496 RepID=A0A151NNV6_ALLMI|nr:hypothetical protein Y1Q_0015694 [Alligator mississippiensis]